MSCATSASEASWGRPYFGCAERCFTETTPRICSPTRRGAIIDSTTLSSLPPATGPERIVGWPDFTTVPLMPSPTGRRAFLAPSESPRDARTVRKPASSTSMIDAPSAPYSSAT